MKDEKKSNTYIKSLLRMSNYYQNEQRNKRKIEKVKIDYKKCKSDWV